VGRTPTRGLTTCPTSTCWVVSPELVPSWAGSSSTPDVVAADGGHREPEVSVHSGRDTAAAAETISRKEKSGHPEACTSTAARGHGDAADGRRPRAPAGAARASTGARPRAASGIGPAGTRVRRWAQPRRRRRRRCLDSPRDPWSREVRHVSRALGASPGRMPSLRFRTALCRSSPAQSGVVNSTGPTFSVPENVGPVEFTTCSRNVIPRRSEAQPH